MSSTSYPKILAFKADGVITKGKAVNIGTDREHVEQANAAADKMIGLAQSTTTAAEQIVEVALPGGGAKGLAQTTIAAGDLLTAHTDGALKPISADGERIIAMALESAVAGDLFACEVVVGKNVVPA